MRFSTDSFLSKLPLAVQEFFQFLQNEGMRPCLVGGVCRDYLYTGSISNDIDLELFPKENIPDEDLLLKFEEMRKKLSRTHQLKELGLNVYQITLEGFELEFTLPRLEIFKEDDKGHRNFEPKFSSLNFEEASDRRDFTVNAIYFEVNNDKVIVHDPKGGLRDIENNILRECSKDFHKDPVRFLRAYRFKIKLGASFTNSLTKELNRMHPEKIGLFYWKYELSKTPTPWIMFEELRESYPLKFEEFSFIEKPHMLAALDEWSEIEDNLERFFQTVALDPFLPDRYKDEVLGFFELSNKKYPYLPKIDKKRLTLFVKETRQLNEEEVLAKEDFEDFFLQFRKINTLFHKEAIHYLVLKILQRLEIPKDYLKALKNSKIKQELQDVPEVLRAKIQFIRLLKGQK